MRHFIPHSVINLDLGPRQSPRDSTIANGSIFLILTHLRSLNPGALARSKFQIYDRVWYSFVVMLCLLSCCLSAEETPELYHNRSETLIWTHAEAPGFNDRKRVHISNIDPFAIVESRELPRGSKSKFQADCGIKPIQQVAQLVQRGDCKAAIALGQRWLSKLSGVDKSALQLQMALAYSKDQEIESSFEIFLEALNHAPLDSSSAVAPEEQRLYSDALSVYLANQGPLAAKGAKDIRRDFAPVIQREPNYHLLGFLVAAAYANLGEFDHFFPLFYSSYCHYPDHYLAHKSKALLSLKLWQRGRIPAEREELRQAVSKNTALAIAQNPKDASLYRMAISFASEAEKAAVVAASLNNIVQGNIMIAREDLSFYVQAAISSGHRDLAQDFVNSARSWYTRSRAVDHAQKMIDSQH